MAIQDSRPGGGATAREAVVRFKEYGGPPTESGQIKVIPGKSGKLGDEEIWFAVDARPIIDNPGKFVYQGNLPTLASGNSREALIQDMIAKNLPPVFTDDPRWPEHEATGA